jgi:branched-chain amino acid transport system substrate-binding protein
MSSTPKSGDMNRRTALGVVGGLVVGGIVGAAGGYYAGQASVPPSVPGVSTTVTATATVQAAATGQLTGEIPIGVMEASDTGNSRPAMQIMDQDINGWLAKVGSPVKLKFLYEDAQGSPDTALSELQSLYAQGVQVVLDLPWSSHIRAMQGYAEEHHILLFSDASTSPLLSNRTIGTNHLIRLVPDDNFQSKALARMLVSKGIKGIVIFQIGDSYGDGLTAALTSRFTDLGGTVLYSIRVDPSAKDFTAQAKLLNDNITSGISKYGKDKVAVELIADVTDTAAIEQAAGAYPTLLQVPWFGCDGYCQDTTLVTQAGALAVQMHNYSTYFAISKSNLYEDFRSKFNAITGKDPWGYVVNMYDTGWITAFSLLMAQSSNADAILNYLPKVCERYFGASGWAELNNAGDKAGGNYDIWAVTNSSNPQWAVVGLYDSTSDTATWF